MNIIWKYLLFTGVLSINEYKQARKQCKNKPVSRLLGKYWKEILYVNRLILD